LAIARALANEPTLLLADEPTGALDSEGGQEVIELLCRLHAGGQTIILVTHDAGVASAAARIVRMRDGRIEVDEGSEIPSAVSPRGTIPWRYPTKSRWRWGARLTAPRLLLRRAPSAPSA
jgi:ABC-type polar amino acid transport system ATPase subunit